MNNEIDVDTYMLQVTWTPFKKLALSANFAYSQATSEMRGANFASDPHTAGDRLDGAKTDAAGAVIIPKAPGPWQGTYDLANLNNVGSYSRLDYGITDVSLGAEYALTSAVDLTVKYQFADLGDDAAYVYGNEDGTFHSVLSYVTFKF